MCNVLPNKIDFNARKIFRRLEPKLNNNNNNNNNHNNTVIIITIIIIVVVMIILVTSSIFPYKFLLRTTFYRLKTPQNRCKIKSPQKGTHRHKTPPNDNNQLNQL